MKNLFEKIQGLNVTGIYLIRIKTHTYVGSTISIWERLREHRGALRNNKHPNIFFQRAFNKYKEAYFSVLEKFSEITKEELIKKEEYWIDLLGSDLNLDKPRQGYIGVKIKPVYQYDKSGKFLKKWISADEVSKALGVQRCSIHTAANPKTKSKSCKGFLFSYEPLTKAKYINNTGINLEKKRIHIYDMQGNFLKSYASISECAKTLSGERNFRTVRTNIWTAAFKPDKRSYLNKYRFSFKKEKALKPFVRKRKEVTRTSQEGEVILFSSIRSAAKNTDINHWELGERFKKLNKFEYKSYIWEVA